MSPLKKSTSGRLSTCRRLDLEDTQTLAVHVDQASLEVEDLDAVAGMLGNPPVDLLGLAQRFFAALAPGDVDIGAGHADGAARGVPRHRTAREEPPDAAVAVEHPVFGLVERRFACDDRLHPAEDGGAVVGMDEPLASRPCDCRSRLSS